MGDMCRLIVALIAAILAIMVACDAQPQTHGRNLTRLRLPETHLVEVTDPIVVTIAPGLIASGSPTESRAVDSISWRVHLPGFSCDLVARDATRAVSPHGRPEQRHLLLCADAGAPTAVVQQVLRGLAALGIHSFFIADSTDATPRRGMRCETGRIVEASPDDVLLFPTVNTHTNRVELMAISDDRHLFNMTSFETIDAEQVVAKALDGRPHRTVWVSTDEAVRWVDAVALIAAAYTLGVSRVRLSLGVDATGSSEDVSLVPLEGRFR
jgi:hypothetical protein